MGQSVRLLYYIQMIFKQLFDTKSSTYTYLISSGKGREALIIDPVKENVGDYIKLLKEVDIAALQVWRETIVFKFKSALPAPVKDIFAFQDWNGAMRFMRKYTRKG